jgi:hypothetical protein
MQQQRPAGEEVKVTGLRSLLYVDRSHHRVHKYSSLSRIDPNGILYWPHFLVFWASLDRSYPTWKKGYGQKAGLYDNSFCRWIYYLIAPYIKCWRRHLKFELRGGLVVEFSPGPGPLGRFFIQALGA